MGYSPEVYKESEKTELTACTHLPDSAVGSSSRSARLPSMVSAGLKARVVAVQHHKSKAT